MSWSLDNPVEPDGSYTVCPVAADIHPHPGIGSNTIAAGVFLPRFHTSRSHTADRPKVPAAKKVVWSVAEKSVRSSVTVLEPGQTSIHGSVRVHSFQSTLSAAAPGRHCFASRSDGAAAGAVRFAVAVVVPFCRNKPFPAGFRSLCHIVVAASQPCRCSVRICR
jgi:hypothetical protein